MEKTTTSIQALNNLIVAYTITAQNARFCHWNVVWPHFEDDHELFGEIYTELSDEVDLFAERVRALRSFPISSFKDILAESQLQEYALPMSARQMQKNILADYEQISAEMEKMAQSITEDVVTQDIIVGAKQQIDKRAWMLRALLWE